MCDKELFSRAVNKIIQPSNQCFIWRTFAFVCVCVYRVCTCDAPACVHTYLFVIVPFGMGCVRVCVLLFLEEYFFFLCVLLLFFHRSHLLLHFAGFTHENGTPQVALAFLGNALGQLSGQVQAFLLTHCL